MIIWVVKIFFVQFFRVFLLPMSHLTLICSMSGSRWLITASWLSRSWRSFLYSSSTYSCHLFLILSASVRSLQFLLLYWAHLCIKCSLGISNFLEKVSSLSHSIIFFSISLHWSLRKAFLSLLAILWKSAFKWVYLSFTSLPFTSFLFTAVYKIHNI